MKRSGLAHVIVVAAAASALAFSAVAGVFATAVIDDFAFATGHAEVVAHGSVSFTGKNLVWQANAESLEPKTDPIMIEGPGFAIADSGSLLVTSYDGRDARLAPGESAFLPGEIVSSLLNLSDGASTFTTFFLTEVALPDATPEGGAIGDVFAAPTGPHAFKLVRDVLTNGETSEFSLGSVPALYYVQRGEIALESSIGVVAVLKANEFTTLNGAITLTSAGTEPSTVFVAILGDEIVGTPTAGSETADPVESDIDITTYLCPAGVSLEQADPESCGGSSGFGTGAFLLTGGSLEAPIAPVLEENIWQWIALETGDYVISIDRYPEGYGSYAIDLDPAAAHVGDDILVTLNDLESPVRVNVYFLDPVNPDDGTTL